jgi:aspartyl protease family protein
MSDPDTVARVVYLVLLLAFLLGFFAWRRGQIGHRLRDLLVWVLIFAMVVIAYGFRDVLREQLLPAAMVQVSGDTIELRRGSDGHFHATLEVNGVPVRFMVDTGASGIVLSRRDAEKIGLDPGALAYLGTAQTANGRVATAGVRLGLVRLGSFTDTGVPATVTEGGLTTSLLGMSYLDRFANIAIAGDVMTLTR